MLMDAITFVGSDELYAKACFSVSTPEVILTVPETVEIGTAISVNAETNIKDGVVEAFVSLLFNESHKEEERKIPVNMCDLLIAVAVAISISIAVKRRR